MSFLNIILLSLVQGVSEFLPISSSAHLLLVSQWVGIQEPSVAFVVALHGGSLLAICLYFFNDLLKLSKGFLGIFAGKVSLEFYQALILIIATLPAILSGFYMNKLQLGTPEPFMIGLFGVFFGILLGVADKRPVRITNPQYMTIKRGLLIGLGQALAVIPGVSRAGITLTVARFLGLSRAMAARFVFLMAVPVILGALVLKGCDLHHSSIPLLTLENLSGMGLSFIFSFLSLHFIITWLETRSLFPIVLYRVLLGSFLLFTAMCS